MEQKEYFRTITVNGGPILCNRCTDRQEEFDQNGGKHSEGGGCGKNMSEKELTVDDIKSAVEKLEKDSNQKNEVIWRSPEDACVRCGEEKPEIQLLGTACSERICRNCRLMNEKEDQNGGLDLPPPGGGC